MATYVNDLRLKEIGTGESSGTWGTETNVNLELIGEALGFGTEAITTNADTHTTTVADGSTDPGRAMYIKYTGTLDSACTITIGPNTINRLHYIENATSGSQNIIISQGSGANITIPAGDTKAVYLDGAGSGAAVVDVFASFNVVDLKVQDDLTVTDDATIGGTLGVTGILTCTDDIIIGDGKTIGSASDVDAMTIAANGQVTFTQTLIGTALDISGDIDVDGTTNLDVVDIDGAVDMVSTLAVADTVTITLDDNADNLSLVTTDADANSGPNLNLYRNSSSPANNDFLGNIKFVGRNNNTQDVQYAEQEVYITDVSDGAEDGLVNWNVMTAGSNLSYFQLRAENAEVVINEDSNDIDFRVESNGHTNMFMVDGGADSVLIAHNASILVAGEAHELQVYDTNFSLISAATFRNGSDGASLSLAHSRSGTVGTQTILNNGDTFGAINFMGSDGTDMASYGARISAEVDGTPGSNDMPGRLIFATTPDGGTGSSERLRILSTGAMTTGGLTSTDGQLHLYQDASFSGKLILQSQVSANATADITFMSRNASNSNVSATLKNVTTALQSSLGISFGSDTAEANAIDDYEEGSWTARYSAATGGVIGGTQVSDAHYVKIGKLVLIEFTLYVSGIDVTGKSGVVTITGLPYDSVGVYGPSELRVTNNTSVFGVFTNSPERVAAAGATLSLFKARSSGVEQELEVTDFATAGGNRNVVYIRHSYRA